MGPSAVEREQLSDHRSFDDVPKREKLKLVK
jgi:hypothetical protein